jgi:hypothetical protein
MFTFCLRFLFSIPNCRRSRPIITTIKPAELQQDKTRQSKASTPPTNQRLWFDHYNSRSTPHFYPPSSPHISPPNLLRPTPSIKIRPLSLLTNTHSMSPMRRKPISDRVILYHTPTSPLPPSTSRENTHSNPVIPKRYIPLPPTKISPKPPDS